MSTILPRPFRQDDLSQVIAVFQDAILNIASEIYSEEQVRVWAKVGYDRDRFLASLSVGLTLVVADPQGIVAFGQLYPSDHINYLYCGVRGRGKGFAAAILAALEREALRSPISEIFTEASLIARPFFEKHGYQILVREVVSRDGVLLPRFKMHKVL